MNLKNIIIKIIFFAEGLDFIDYIFIPHYKSDYHKVHLIEKIVEKMPKRK